MTDQQPPSPPPQVEDIFTLDPRHSQTLLALARRSIVQGLETGRPLSVAPEEFDEPLRARRAAFVTLTTWGNLRGCIGHLEAIQPLVRDVADNAFAAAFRDPRFPPLAARELGPLQIEISVLTPPKTVDGVEDIAIGRDGILIDRGGRRAVFLPQVAPEQNWDLETTLAHLAMKAGMPADAWRTNTTFQTFQAQVFHEMR